MERSVKERLAEFIQSQNISVREFERRADLSNGYLKSLRKSPTIDKMRSIISAYPMLNQDWLLTGEGNMLVESIEPTCGYLLLNNGISIEMVAKMLGHANIQTTQKVYAKILDKTMDKAFNGLEKRMGIKK